MKESDRTLREIWSMIFELVLAHRGPFMASLAELGLTPPQATALRALDAKRAVPMKELGERLACDTSTLTGIVDRLEARGLVERRSRPGDRRAKALVLTAKGRATRAEAVNRMAEPPTSLATLSREDRRTLRDILSSVETGKRPPVQDMDDVVASVVAALEARDWETVHSRLHPYVRWQDASGGRIRGRTKVLEMLKTIAPPGAPTSYELRDRQIYRWTC